MKVLQLIDSLCPGGAEKMAVSYANALSTRIENSFLCCTRSEGPLTSQLSPKVRYLFLNKKSSFDFAAFWKLKNFVKEKKIDLVHTHGTSWFYGVLLKVFGCKAKVVWHNHSGESSNLRTLNRILLTASSGFFDGVICVNRQSFLWSRKSLFCQFILQLNNFTIATKGTKNSSTLKGPKSGLKLVCVANIRPQKDHLNLINAFEEISEQDVTLHLIGAKKNDQYSEKIFEQINRFPGKIFYYGIRTDTQSLLEQCDIGVLGSRTEGLPLVLLEYGLAELPVVCTDVGECAEVVDDCGEIVPPKDPIALAIAIKKYMNNPEKRRMDGNKMLERVEKYYSEKAVLPQLIAMYKELI